MIEYTEQERKDAAEKVYLLRFPSRLIGDEGRRTIERWADSSAETHPSTVIAIDLQMRLTKAEELLLKYRFQHRRSADCKIFANIAGDQRCPICTKYDAFLEGSKA